MVLLLKKDCGMCNDIRQMASEHPEVKILYIENGMMEENGSSTRLNPQIDGLPAIIFHKNGSISALIGRDLVIEFLQKLGTQTGE